MITYYLRTDEYGENDVLKNENGELYCYRYGGEQWEPINTAVQRAEISEKRANEQINENRKMYDRLLVLADAVAENAHKGQMCRDGKPYISHPRTVASFIDDTERKIIALLHDTIEDTEMTEEALIELGFTKRIVRSVKVLTRSEGEDYFNYVRNIKSDPNARYVKIADLTHNMDISRLPKPTPRDFERLEKYKKAMEIIRSWD